MKSYRVFWSLAAELRLLRIHAYYADRAGIRVANKLMREVVNATVRLGRQPLIGQVEPLLDIKNLITVSINRSYKILSHPLL